MLLTLVVRFEGGAPGHKYGIHGRHQSLAVAVSTEGQRNCGRGIS